MMYEGISHRCGYNDCYCLNENELRINLHANRSVTKAVLVCEDPYINGISGASFWDGKPVEMKLSSEMAFENIFSVTGNPPYKRLQYYFLLTFDDGSSVCLLEDGIHDTSVIRRNELAKHFFKFAWMNDSDICKPPKWVQDTIWYQIFPDRFCRVEDGYNGNFKNWDDMSCRDHKSLYGGNIKGIVSRLDYLGSLGITGIYFNPVFLSRTNHRYDTTDYEVVDPAFGTNEEFVDLVRKAHAKGIKIMIDAVFNHSGTDFFAWKDVLKNGRDSEFFDWYYVNDLNFNKKGNTKDGRFYTFAFVAEMPKLNTNNPKVVSYFTDICKKWIEEFDIDGIRFDVGNEISHRFIKHLNIELKKIKPELFLLGEIWTDSAPYLDGDEYDSVMNYPFMQVIGNFFRDRQLNAVDFKHKINYCYSMYKQQINYALFNLLDSHDVSRLINMAGSYDCFIQQLTLLFTMPGSPCIYYGTEIALEGENDPYNRRPMPWKDIDSGKYLNIFDEVRALIELRKHVSFKSAGELVWEQDDHSRLIHYSRGCDGKPQVFINANEYDTDVCVDGKILFSHKYASGRLEKGGVVVFVKEQ